MPRIAQASFQPVEFTSQGATLRGRLYAPKNGAKRSPTVIMAHGFSATIRGMVADRFAEVFYDAGLTVLLYEHRNFGISDGKPRQEVNRWVQARGYLDALDFLSKNRDPGPIALWGDSASAAEAMVAATMDSRVKAVVAQVPACGNTPPPDDSDGTKFAALKERFLHGDVSTSPDKVVGPLPVVSSDQLKNPSLLEPLTAFRWFIEYGGRYDTLWENWATVGGPKFPVPLHPALCTPHLKADLLMMVAQRDEMPGANSDISQIVFERAAGPKEMVAIEGGHFGLLYHPGPIFDSASGKQRVWLEKRLA